MCDGCVRRWNQPAEHRRRRHRCVIEKSRNTSRDHTSRGCAHDFERILSRRRVLVSRSGGRPSACFETSSGLRHLGISPCNFLTSGLTAVLSYDSQSTTPPRQHAIAYSLLALRGISRAPLRRSRFCSVHRQRPRRSAECRGVPLPVAGATPPTPSRIRLAHTRRRLLSRWARAPSIVSH